MFYILFLLLVPSFTSIAQAQDAQPTRSGEIEAAQREKTRQLEPDIPDKAERVITAIRDRRILERITEGIAGVRIKVGGLVTGSGFGAGPEYLRRDLVHGNIVFRASARASMRWYQLYDVQLTFPKLAHSHYFVDLHARRRDYPGINYYGPGPGSRKSGRSNFKLEDMSFDLTTGAQVSFLKLGATGGYLKVNTGPGRDDRFISTERIYSPLSTPGLDRQSDFGRAGVFAQFDYRDNPGGPRKGGNYMAKYLYYRDMDFHRYTFRKLDVDLEQYIPFFNQRRVIALRAKTELTYRNPGQVVPFYLQPVLGGSDDLRGFRPFRFYDDNLLVVNGEYRWEVFSGLDMALFADGGKVFARHAALNFRDLERSFGFGFRFNVRNNVFMRLDVGFSREGFQVWVKFNNVF